MSEPISTSPAPLAALASQALDLPSGRRLVVEASPVERLLIHAPSGEIELSIELTPQGPVLKARALRLDLEATESVRIAAPDVEIAAGQNLKLSSQGAAELTAEQDVVVLGACIHLN